MEQIRRNGFLAKYSILVVVLAVPAIWNGFPLLYPDTCRYLKTAIDFRLNCWSPVAFPFLARPVFIHGPWVWMTAQCALAAAVLLDSGRALSLRFGLLLFTVAASGYFYTTSLLLSDVYFPLLFLAAFLYLESGRMRYLPLVLLLSTAHAAFILIGLLTVLALFPFKAFSRKRLAVLCAIFASALAANSFFAHKQYRTLASPCQPAFLAGRLIGNDPEFFLEYCAKNPDGFFRPDREDTLAVSRVARETGRADHFLWNPKSPIHSGKWLRGDGSPGSDLGKASREFKDFIMVYVRQNPGQFLASGAANLASYLMLPRTYFATEVATMQDFSCLTFEVPRHSLQKNGYIRSILMNKTTAVFYFLSLAVITAFLGKALVAKAACLARHEKRCEPFPGDAVHRFCLYSLILHLCNGLITANLSTLDGRFQQWVYPVLFIAAATVLTQSPAIFNFLNSIKQSFPASR